MQGINFDSIMIQALLRRQKSFYREPLTLTGHQGVETDHGLWRYCEIHSVNEALFQHRVDIKRVITEIYPKGLVGTKLYVKESYALGTDKDVDNNAILYRADGKIKPGIGDFESFVWRPSVCMTKEQSRIIIEISSIDVGHMQDCSIPGLYDEGFLILLVDSPYIYYSNGAKDLWRYRKYSESYRMYMRKKYGAKMWEMNPYMWMIKFNIVEIAKF